MKKHLIVIGTAVLLLAVWLNGCNEINTSPSEEDRFVGTWKNEDGRTIVFFANGTGSDSTFGSVHWKIKDNLLVRELDNTIYTLEEEYKFSDNDKTLTLANMVYTKQ